MKVEYAPTQPQPVTKENIVVAGEVIGTIEFQPANPANYQPKDRYYASLLVKAHGVYSVGGFGATKEEAIASALGSGRTTVFLLTAELDALELKISGIDGTYDRDM